MKKLTYSVPIGMAMSLMLLASFDANAQQEPINTCVDGDPCTEVWFVGDSNTRGVFTEFRAPRFADEGWNLRSFAARLQSVTAGALRVTWQNRDNVRPDVSVGVPAGTISETTTPIPGLGEIDQIGYSFGGRPVEDRKSLFTRASERLRHKQRAVSPWDYERLVLEAFPNVRRMPSSTTVLRLVGRPSPSNGLLPRPPGKRPSSMIVMASLAMRSPSFSPR